jgi:hypothetical protein
MKFALVQKMAKQDATTKEALKELSSQMTMLSSQMTMLISQMTMLSSQMTMLSSQMTNVMSMVQDLSIRDGIHPIVLRTLSGFCYLCQQLAYLVDSRIFLMNSKIGESLRSYQEYPAKSVGKQGEEFPIAALVKS